MLRVVSLPLESNPHMPDAQHQSLSDEALWAEYVDGSDAAFDEVRRRYQEPLFRYLLLSGTELRTASQALGQILCHASLHRRRLEGFDSLKGWLFAIATQQAVPAHVPEQEGLMDFISQMKRGEPTSPEDNLRRALFDVRRDLRQPFLLVAVFGLSIAQAARACRFPPDQTAHKLKRAYREISAAVPRLKE